LTKRIVNLYEHRKDINITRSTPEADEINVAQALA